MPKRAVGIIRVSRTGGRSGETFHSPTTQRQRIEAECERQSFKLLEIHEELDVSGGKPLDERLGLLDAVTKIEAKEAEVLVSAYLDRLTRSIQVRSEVIERVEAAGGLVLTVDMGIQTDATAGQWLTGTMSSAVAEYLRRTTAERAAVAQQRSIDRGVIPFPYVPPGYVKPQTGQASNGRIIYGPLQIDPKTAPVVREAFAKRAAGATIKEVREFLCASGIEVTYRSAQGMLKSALYLGQIHFGTRYEPNLEAHEPLIPADLWRAVQEVCLPRGPKAKSERLLARLGVLRCGTCGGRMSVGTQTQNGRNYPFYRCSPTSDCQRRMAISARIAEAEIEKAVSGAIVNIEDRAAAEHEAQQAAGELAKTEEEFDAALRVLSDFEDEDAAVRRLASLRDARDRARDHAERLGGLSASVVVRGSEWGTFDIPLKRALIEATVEAAFVNPGKGAGRLDIKLFR